MQINVNQLNHVAIHVEDVTASLAFYSDVLQLKPLPRPAFDFPGAWFSLGDDQELHLIGDRTLPVHSHNRGTHFALRVPDIRSAEAHLKQMNVSMKGPHNRPDGAWQIFIQDPDGHVVELTQLTSL